ncbi:class D sortase [Clostridium sp. NSJ-49]|uniref:Sortase n=1 Tax=Clostridium disporicum TaxID=84024 RepID=A0A174HVH8_9CLOT|nr:class D sortase [Clostridium disporicum]MBC5624435.1 class D sortase [Clostridium sp. NSJ-49]CUO77148.1 sortase [Clostridium disporicum]
MDKFRRGIGLLLIAVGLIIIGTVVYKKVETIRKQKAVIEMFESSISEGSLTSKEEVNLEDINGYTPIAIIEIPSIKLSQALVEGISDDVLKYFLGHFNDSAAPGEKGNFAVAGHRVSDYTDAFINLYKVKAGDEVIVKTHDKKYTYVVEDNFIVEPEDVHVLDDTKEATMTLVTCTVGAKQRVIVKGRLISEEELNS